MISKTMSTIIPNEIISEIIGYVSDSIGFDYKYCRYRKTYRFSYSENNTVGRVINELITNKWSIRRFYHMSNPNIENLVKLPNFKIISPWGILYHTPKTSDDINVKISVFTNIDGITVIGLYKGKYSVENLFHQTTISDKNIITHRY